MIPKNLHLVWFGDNKPANTEEIIKQWEDLGWVVYFWLNGKLIIKNQEKEEIDDSFKKVLDSFDLLVAKSDALRIYAVNKFGGVYIDFDFTIVKPIDELLNCPSFVGREDKDKICNAIFGSIENTDFLKYQLHKLKLAPKETYVWGVNLITNAVFKNPEFPVLIYPQEYFYPYPWHEQDESKKVAKENTYLIHKWDKSWWEIK